MLNRQIASWTKRLAGGFVLLLVIARTPAAPPPVRSAMEAELDRYIREEMKLNQIPGLSLAVVKGREIVHVGAYGVKSLATGEAMAIETPVDLASVSKSFTALAIVQLEQAGKLELDEPVQRYLPEFWARDRQASAAITVRHLVRHTSGLAQGDRRLPCCEVPRDLELARSLEALHGERLRRAVGSSFRYSNSNYIVLAAVVERLAAEPFPVYLKTRVFEPLGMLHTTVDQVQARAWGMAEYHEQQWGRMKPSPTRFGGWYGASAVKSNAPDMARYAIALLHGDTPALARVLRAERPGDAAHSVPSGPFPEGSGYDLGWFLTPRAEWLGGTRIIQHSGDIRGANAAVVVAPELGWGVVVLLNAGVHRAAPIARGILTRVAGFPSPEAARASWGEIPDNWAVVFVAAAGCLFAGLAWLLARAGRQFERGQRRFRWDVAHPAPLRALLLLAMAAYLVWVFAGGPLTELDHLPTTIQTALPLLAAAVVALLLANAILTFAPTAHTSRGLAKG